MESCEVGCERIEGKVRRWEKVMVVGRWEEEVEGEGGMEEEDRGEKMCG